jgi:hypothetical protein
MTESKGGLHIRPAIVVRVGPSHVSEANVGQIGLKVFLSAEDYYGRSEGDPPSEHCDSIESPTEGEWAAGAWRWPTRA